MSEYETKREFTAEFRKLDPGAVVEFKDAQRVEIFDVTLFGRDLTVTLTDSQVDEQAGFRFRIDVIDEATGQSVGRGNGGQTLDEAVSAFHWYSLESELRALPED